MKKKKKIIIASVCVAAAALIGIGGKLHLDDQVKQKQLKENLLHSKAEITELLEWNYKGIKSVTFYYDGSGGSGVSRVPFDDSLATTPAGDLTICGYVNEDKNIGFSASLNPITMRLEGDYGGYPMLEDKLYKNPNPITEGDIQSSANYYLTPSDINILKKQGYTKDIPFEKIKQYFEEKDK